MFFILREQDKANQGGTAEVIKAFVPVDYRMGSRQRQKLFLQYDFVLLQKSSAGCALARKADVT
jgi:hypothetical protein